MDLTDPRTLRAGVAALGVVPAATGLATLLRGTSVIRGRGTVSPSVESEHRFLAVWWTALGPVLWSVSRTVDREPRRLQVVAGCVFAGGVARLAAARQVGRPDPLYEALTAVELALPVGLLAWQRVVRPRPG